MGMAMVLVVVMALPGNRLFQAIGHDVGVHGQLPVFVGKSGLELLALFLQILGKFCGQDLADRAQLLAQTRHGLLKRSQQFAPYQLHCRLLGLLQRNYSAPHRGTYPSGAGLTRQDMVGHQ